MAPSTADTMASPVNESAQSTDASAPAARSFLSITLEAHVPVQPVRHTDVARGACTDILVGMKAQCVNIATRDTGVVRLFKAAGEREYLRIKRRTGEYVGSQYE